MHADRNRARRSRRPKCFLNASSSVTMRPTSCAMARLLLTSVRVRPGTALRPLWPWPRPRPAPSDGSSRLRPGASRARRRALAASASILRLPLRLLGGDLRGLRVALGLLVRGLGLRSCSRFLLLAVRLVQLLLLLALSDLAASSGFCVLVERVLLGRRRADAAAGAALRRAGVAGRRRSRGGWPASGSAVAAAAAGGRPQARRRRRRRRRCRRGVGRGRAAGFECSTSAPGERRRQRLDQLLRGQRRQERLGRARQRAWSRRASSAAESPA